MQPHSAATMLLVRKLFDPGFNKKKKLINATCIIKFELPSGRSREIYYTLSDFDGFWDRNDQLTSFMVNTKRSGDPLSCRIKVTRSSNGSFSEGETFTFEHMTSHTAGFAERFKLYSKSIKDGRHYNSRKYKDFSGEFNTEDSLILISDVRIPDTNYYRKYKFTVKKDSLNIEVVEPKVENTVPENAVNPGKGFWQGFGKKAP